MPHPNPLTAEELARGDEQRQAALEAALAAIDQEALFTELREQLVASVWDRTSDVNGVDAERVLASAQPPAGGAVVLIATTDGQVQVLQPFHPERGLGVAIDPDEAQALAEAMADTMAADAARGAAFGELDPALLPDPEQAPPAEPDAPDARDERIAELEAHLAQQAEQVAAMREELDWTINFVVTGEA